MAGLVARTYFALGKFSQLNFLYQFDVNFVMRILKDAFAMLDAVHVDRSTDSSSANNEVTVNSEEKIIVRDGHSYRLRALYYYYFRLLYTRVLRAMFTDDHTVAALRIAQLRGSICFDKSNSLQNSKCIS